ARRGRWRRSPSRRRQAPRRCPQPRPRGRPCGRAASRRRSAASAAPRPPPQREDAAVHLHLQRLGGAGAHAADGLQVDARLHAERVQQVHDVLGGDVAGGARDERAAAQAAEGGVEARHAGAQAGHEVGDPQAAGVVQVQHQGHAGGGRADLVHQALDAHRVGEPGGVGDRQLLDPGLGDAGRQPHDALGRHLVHPAAEGALHAAADGQAEVARQGDRLQQVGLGLLEPHAGGAARVGVPQVPFAYADDLTGAARDDAGATLSARIGPNALLEMAPLAKYAVLENGHRTFFAMGQNTDFGRSMVEAFRAVAESLGGSFVAEPVYFPFANADFRTLLTRARDSGADAIVAIGLAQEMIGIVLQHDELGLTQPIYASDLMADASVQEAVGAPAQNTFSPWYYDQGEEPRTFARQGTEPGATALREAGEELLGIRPSRNHALGWGTVMLLKQAMERAGS